MARFTVFFTVLALAAIAQSFSISKVSQSLSSASQYVYDKSQSLYDKGQYLYEKGQSYYNSITPPDFCKRPAPYNLSDIQPEIHMFTRDQAADVTITDEKEFPDLVREMESGAWIKKSRPITFLVHGFMGYTPLATWLTDVKDAILKNEDGLVLMVEWSKGANVFYNYGQSASNTQTVGKALAKLATAILNGNVFKGDTDALYLHCIGHSLGAHVCGQTGRHSKIFDRVTGLDPAGPGFENCTDGININTDSAACVDNIHTDGTRDGHWNPVVPYFGSLSNWGHIDFYPNNGGNQVGCKSNDLPPCSHSRVNLFFAYTIAQGPNACIASGTTRGSGVQASQPAGYFSSCHKSRKQVQQGKFYLTTGGEAPYC